MLTNTLETQLVNNFARNAQIIHELAHAQAALSINPELKAAQIRDFGNYLGCVFPASYRVSRGFYAAGVIAEQSFAAAFAHPHALDNLANVNSENLEIQKLLSFSKASSDDLEKWLDLDPHESDLILYQQAWNFGLQIFMGLDKALEHLTKIDELLKLPNMGLQVDSEYFEGITRQEFPDRLAVVFSQQAA